MERVETPTAGGRRRRRAWSAASALALALASAVGVALVVLGVGLQKDQPPLTAPRGAPLTPTATASVSVTIDLRHRGRPVPARFLGLSFEASSLAQMASYGESGNFVNLLRSLGPGLLRFGGASADTRIAWVDPLTPRPAWSSSVLEAPDLRRLRVLAARSGWRVLLTVGLAHYDPIAAAHEALAAKRALGPWLAGVEIGNEPDAYLRHGLRSPPWTPARYGAQFRSYRTAIGRLAPGVALAGPGVSGSHSFVRWAQAIARTQRPALLTGHHYPLGCRQVPQPSIARLLSAQTRRRAAASLARYMSLSHSRRIPFRMDEANSVSCGGRAGISDTFASALWATDYISQAMAAGLAGINLEGNPSNCLGYSPVCATSAEELVRGVLTVRPIWYALLLTKALIGDRPLRTSVFSPHARNLAVRALISANGSLHFVIVDDDPPASSPLAVSLHVGSRFGAARRLALTAPSPEATSGVTLGGRTVAADGSWQRQSGLGSIPAHGGAITLTIPPSSAALVTVTPAGTGQRD